MTCWNGSATFTWNISHTNQPPTLDNPGDQLDQTGDVVSLPLFGYDEDSFADAWKKLPAKPAVAAGLYLE